MVTFWYEPSERPLMSARATTWDALVVVFECAEQGRLRRHGAFELLLGKFDGFTE
jgi:hypothetical protein